jgi:hypothetical protein
MMAQAAQQVLMQNQAKAAQMQAQQQMQDPVLQMQMQELQLKGQELELKKQKIMMDAAAKADAQGLKEQEVSGKLELEALRTGAQIKESELKQQFEQERAGSRWVLTSQRVKPRWIYKRVLLRSQIVATKNLK